MAIIKLFRLHTWVGLHYSHGRRIVKMCLFRKNLHKYKVMDKYRRSLGNFFIFGETEKYHLYLDKEFKQYILRQDKQHPKKVVYLGWLRGEVCVFHGRIFYINRWSYTGRSENPLNFIEIETGRSGKIAVLSHKGFWNVAHWHCQDVVNRFALQDDKLVINVTRYKENSHDEKELTYVIHIIYDEGHFKINRILPNDSATGEF